MANELDEAVVEQPSLKQDVKVEKRGACERHVTVTIAAEEIDRYFQKQFDELVPKAEVPGFRIGKAPRSLVENKFRKQIGDQVKGMILMDSLSQVSNGNEFAAIGEPDLDFDAVDLPDAGALTYEFNIEVRPEFELPNWRGLELERPEHEFKDAEIERSVDEFFTRATTAHLVPVDEPVAVGDFVVIRLVSRVDGKILSESDEETIQVRPRLVLSDASIDDFQQRIVGKRSGEKLEFELQISEFAENEALQGKPVMLELEILDVKRHDRGDRQAALGALGGMGEDDVRRYVRGEMQRRLEYQQRQQLRNQISRLLTESAEWELPQGLLRRQSRRELERAVMEMHSSGLSDSEVQARENLLRQDVLQRTATMLKEHFILERIAEEEKVEDKPEDYDREIARIAAQRNESPRKIRARLEKSGQMDTLRNMIVEQKVIELIESHAKFKKVPYASGETAEVVGIDFFAGGEFVSDIPTAQHDPSANEPFLQKYGDKKERG